MIHKTKNRNKKHFCKSCSQCFSSKNVLTEHKEACLSINGAQSVKLGKQTIEFKYCFKRIPVPFEIYADFESNLGSVESYEGFYSKKIPRSYSLQFFLTSFFVLMINLPSQYLCLEAKMMLMNLLNQFLSSISIVKQ